jgi:ankyrin repeat protein
MRLKHMVLSSVIAFALVAGFLPQVDAAPIHDAVEVGNWDAVKEQLDQGVDVNAQNKNGSTALTRAAYNGYTDVVQELLTHPDINIGIKNTKGKTALDIAREENRTAIVKLIEEHQEQINNYKTKSARKA